MLSWHFVNAIVNGGLAGLFATVPMTLAMLAMHRRLPPGERYPLPPREITVKVAHRAGAADQLHNEERRTAATYMAHFAFGAAAGTAFGPVAARVGHPIAAGVLYGLAVWAGAYLGVLPELGIRESATRQPPRREGLMAAAHLVWGAGLGMFSERFSNRA